MKKQISQPLHIKLDYNESISSKKELLQSQISLLNSIRHLQEYKNLRKIELIKKLEVKNHIREIVYYSRSLMERLPHVELPKVEEKEIEKVVMDKIKKTEIEEELEQIQERLAKLM